MSEQAAAVAPLLEEQEEEHADATCGHPSTTIDGDEGLDDGDEYICGCCLEPIDGREERWLLFMRDVATPALQWLRVHQGRRG